MDLLQCLRVTYPEDLTEDEIGILFNVTKSLGRLDSFVELEIVDLYLLEKDFNLQLTMTGSVESSLVITRRG